jgi:Helix-turn-helix domain
MSEPRYKVTDEGALHKYRAEIPNTVVRGIKSRGLSVYAKWLYVYFKSVAGDGGLCFQSTTTIAAESGMSRGQVSAAKKELAKHALISIVPGQNPRRDADHIRIKDIWLANIQEFSVHNMNTTDKNEEIDLFSIDDASVHNMNTSIHQCSQYEQGVHNMNTSVHNMNQRRTLEEDPNKKEDSPLPPSTARKPIQFAKLAEEVLGYFNHVHGRNLRNHSQIETLLKTGVSVEECKLVIDWLYQVERITNRDGYDKYVDNVTPFRPQNFDRHRDKAVRWKATPVVSQNPYEFKVVT